MFDWGILATNALRDFEGCVFINRIISKLKIFKMTDFIIGCAHNSCIYLIVQHQLSIFLGKIFCERYHGRSYDNWWVKEPGSCPALKTRKATQCQTQENTCKSIHIVEKRVIERIQSTLFYFIGRNNRPRSDLISWMTLNCKFTREERYVLYDIAGLNNMNSIDKKQQKRQPAFKVIDLQQN